MAHFAELDDNNVVLRVIVVANGVVTDENRIESESKGVEFCQSLFGGRWVQTSYNNNFRKRFAAVGGTYDAVKDAFVLPRPYSQWHLNPDTLDWEPPTPYPNDGKHYIWREDLGEWFFTGVESDVEGVPV